MKIILQKYIAQSGYCSRRKAEALIRAGKVLLNGRAAEPGSLAGEEDEIKIGKKIIKPAKEKIYIALNKPAGYTCTNRLFKNEKSVFALLPKKYCNLHIAGRLDKNSRGLLLLTNDGALTEKLTHPRFEHEKKYLVQLKLEGKAEIEIDKIVKNFKAGVIISQSGEAAKAKRIKYLGGGRFEIILAEGKKRQIRKMFEAIGCEVADLKRISIGKLNIGNLEEAQWKFLTDKDVRLLLNKKVKHD